MHTRVPEIKSLMSLKTVPKLDTHSATVLHLLRQPVHRRGSDSNHGLGLDTLFIDTHEQNFLRRLLPLELNFSSPLSKMTYFGRFGDTKNGTSGARIKILRPLFNRNTPLKPPLRHFWNHFGPPKSDF